jgi:hypothetical protein
VPQPKGLGVLAPRLNPPHAQKTLQSGLKSPDRHLGTGVALTAFGISKQHESQQVSVEAVPPIVQEKPIYRLDASQTNVLALSNLDHETELCQPARIYGTIVQQQFDDKLGTVVTGVTVKEANGQRTVANVDVNLDRMDMVTKGWVTRGLQLLLKEGNRVELGVKLCGAAGRVVMVDSIAAASDGGQTSAGTLSQISTPKQPTEEALATSYQSNFLLAGFLVRAAAVCNVDSKRTISVGFDLVGTPELTAISKAYPDTTTKWMKDGAEKFNSKVMSDGIGPACAYAINERRKAEAVPREPLLGKQNSDEGSDNSEKSEYTVLFKGTCKYKFINRSSFFPCDQTVKFENFTNHHSEFMFTVLHGSKIFNFSGNKDRQPNLGNYFLSVNKARFGDVSGGVEGNVEGECHMLQNADGSKFYEIKCDVFDRKAGFEFNFYLTEISGFERKGSR